MEIEWDENKNRANRAKHHVSFENAALVFDDPRVISFPERNVEGEERWRMIGSVDGQIILTVAHTVRDERGGEAIRIISARKATPSERSLYFHD